jgi:hypothetical protein
VALGQAAEQAAGLTNAYNLALDQTLIVLHALPRIQFIPLDINALFNTIVQNPAAVGLADVEDACLNFGVGGDAICSTPNRFLVWDGALWLGAPRSRRGGDRGTPENAACAVRHGRATTHSLGRRRLWPDLPRPRMAGFEVSTEAVAAPPVIWRRHRPASPSWRGPGAETLSGRQTIRSRQPLWRLSACD